MWMSVPQIAVLRIRIMTSFGPTLGSGTFSSQMPGVRCDLTSAFMRFFRRVCVLPGSFQRSLATRPRTCVARLASGLCRSRGLRCAWVDCGTQQVRRWMLRARPEPVGSGVIGDDSVAHDDAFVANEGSCAGDDSVHLVL